MAEGKLQLCVLIDVPHDWPMQFRKVTFSCLECTSLTPSHLVWPFRRPNFNSLVPFSVPLPPHVWHNFRQQHVGILCLSVMASLPDDCNISNLNLPSLNKIWCVSFLINLCMNEDALVRNYNIPPGPGSCPFSPPSSCQNPSDL